MLKKLLKTLYKYWMIFARFLGRINSRVLLTVFYFLIFGIVSLIRKLFKLFKVHPETVSYWLKKAPKHPRDYEQQF